MQFSADDGEPQWLKRFGQRDAWDYVADIAINRQHSTIYMTGSYVGSSSGLQDIFSMEAAGRLDVISCPPWSGPRWSTTSNQFEFEHITNESVASCKLEPFSITDPAGARSGFIMEIGEGDTESTGEKPWQKVIREAALAAQAEQQRKIEELGPTGVEVPIIVPWVIFFLCDKPHAGCSLNFAAAPFLSNVCLCLVFELQFLHTKPLLTTAPHALEGLLEGS